MQPSEPSHHADGMTTRKPKRVGVYLLTTTLFLFSSVMIAELSIMHHFKAQAAVAVVVAAVSQSNQTIDWAQQGIKWTVPADWSKMSEAESLLHWKSPGAGDAAQLMVNVSSLGPSFPVDASLKAMWDAASTRQKNGEITDLNWLDLDGVKGIRYREKPPQDLEDVQRLQWQGYRKRAGQIELVNIIISSQGKTFDKHLETMTAVLGSTKIAK